MTLILAIACVDRIVVASDGRSTDSDTGKVRTDVTKIFELTNNSAILIAGSGLIDAIGSYMEGLVEDVRKLGHDKISDIARDCKTIINRREWAEHKEIERSHLEAIIVGYDHNKPAIYIILDNRDYGTDVVAHAIGNWDEKINFLRTSLSNSIGENTKKTGNKVAIEALMKAEISNPKEIGGKCTLWHVMPHGIKRLEAADINKLQARYSD